MIRAAGLSRARSPARVAAVLVLLSSAAWSTGCFDATNAFTEGDLLQQPADSVFNFLGYFDTANGVTVCGTCHVDKQAGWKTTGHAEAWTGLQNSGHAQDFCEGCHTVNENGNALDERAGFNLVKDARYHDVQCENCHGPGLEHVQGLAASPPLAPIAVGPDLGTGCGDCHQGKHHPFVNQWTESRHGNPVALRWTGRDPTCAPCHEGRTILAERFGETANYLEKNGTELVTITCAVCHDPHGSPNASNLRAPIDVATTEHLCVTCHSRRATPPAKDGPHGAQGPLVLGENAGWIPPGFDYDTRRIIGTHGSAANAKLCVTCHANQFEVTDPETGDFVFNAVGHTFDAIPCLDADGVPTTGDCAVAQRDFSSCATSQCHGEGDAGEAVARSLFATTKGRIENLLDQLWVDTDGDRKIDASDAGLLPQVVALGDTAQLDVSDDVVTVAEGALWNAILAYTNDRTTFAFGSAFGIHWTSHKSSGEGVHNPFLLEVLLTLSIQAVTSEYGLAPPPIDLTVKAAPPPGLRRQ